MTNDYEIRRILCIFADGLGRFIFNHTFATFCKQRLSIIRSLNRKVFNYEAA